MSLASKCPSYRVILDKVHRLFVTLSYFRPDRFVHLHSLIPILILLLCVLVLIDLVYTGILARLEEKKRQMITKLNYIFSG